ncbi:hypothetical protein PR202_ga01752 [Eleusine coracana subsp. coracana]|uniref:protein-serine/threonine phosphatase n=1 Tax=Eleusine coracana subsp. coracana TaxID=191504 RepID=A0AAV5BJ42_ELECO|nr:hypothetical protein PR202_ga01065 [Eleusine coracana subsp. coracana]GJM85942.1 hypothetical protein PR202_ga01752 [Eleusine coracana subsp. coracana]
MVASYFVPQMKSEGCHSVKGMNKMDNLGRVDGDRMVGCGNESDGAYVRPLKRAGCGHSESVPRSKKTGGASVPFPCLLLPKLCNARGGLDFRVLYSASPSHVTTTLFLTPPPPLLSLPPFHLPLLASQKKAPHRKGDERRPPAPHTGFVDSGGRLAVAGKGRRCLHGRRGPAAAVRGEAPAPPCRWPCCCGGRWCTERTAAERPELQTGLFSQAKKGEDFTFLKPECERVPGIPSSSFSAFGLFDGHNGNGAAIYTKENLLNNVLSAVPADLNREDWLAALPRALVAAFVKTDKDFQTKARSSGTTVSFVIIDGLIITVASVGDSRCVLEAEGSIYHLSSDHRFDENKEEVDRVTESGGDVGRLNVVGGAEIGPLRCWPGGLCLSRSIGDQDVGEFIVPVPLVKQVKLSTAGGRLIIASDGVWDALSPEAAFNCSRELPPEPAAEQIVKTAVQSKGLRDDTTCIVVDIIAEKSNSSMPLPKKQPGIGVFKNMFRKKTSSDSSSHADREYMDPDIVEEIFEDECALLSRRLVPDFIFIAKYCTNL